MRRERQYLSDIVEAAESISGEVANRSFEQFLDDPTLQRSVLFGFAVIGEAANKISKSTRDKYPEIAWASMISFRNIIVHAYFSIDLKTVWAAAKRRVLPLSEQVQAILRNDFREQD